MPAAPPVPPLPLIQRALRVTTERLARELAKPGATQPAWNEFEWDMARAAAAVQGIGPLLAHRLTWRGPDRWSSFLSGQIEHGLKRAVRIESLLMRLDDVTRRAGVPVVALKGAALLRKPLYAPGERPMGDIDLLAQPDDMPGIAEALESLGYHHEFTNPRHAVFSPAAPAAPLGLGEHAAHPLKIEVHTLIADALPVTRVDITAHIRPEGARTGLNLYRDDASLMLHLVLHAAGNMRAHCLRLIQLEDLARFSRLMHAAQWTRFLTTGDGGRAPWWALPPLLLAQRYCEARLPAEVMAALHEATPRPLRRAAQRCTLTDVSWSNLRIDAFPGIEWSRTLLEAMRFAMSRIAPGRQALANLDAGLKAAPLLSQVVPWYGIPHASRIIRWLFTRPPRVQTLCSVLAALDR